MSRTRSLAPIVRLLVVAFAAGPVACMAPPPASPPAPSPSNGSPSNVATNPPSASPSAALPSASPSSASPPPTTLGAGFRYSTYGPGFDPGPAYWVRVGQEMAGRFDRSTPEAVWIVGNFSGNGTVLTFPGETDELTIGFSASDQNEAALTLFDEQGIDVWLQVEPGDAPVDQLIDIMLDRYGDHPCVIGVGVDVEWYHSTGEPEGEAVPDELAREWVAAARAHDPAYRLFLKHWEIEKMPPTVRDGIVFIDDSQQFTSLDQMVDEFEAWGAAFAPAEVGFQYGYPDDESWWGELDDPPGDIGDAILERVPNTAGLYWVDFTVRQVFPP